MSVSTSIDQIALGDTLVDLDNGYVVDIEEDAGDELSSGKFGFRFGEGLFLITMHDRDGEEFYLIAPPTMEVRVES